jgi:hypothetical protein
MLNKRTLKKILPMILICAILIGCSSNEMSEIKLKKVKGYSLTYSEYFKPYDKLDERDNIKYYKPLSIDEARVLLPEKIKKENTIDSTSLPFPVNEKKAYLVTSVGEDRKINNQIQLSYLNKSENGIAGNFYIISMTEVNQNPLEGYNISGNYDTVGNQFTKEKLTEDLSIYHQVLTTNSALLYRYYDYDETEKKINTIGTTANEFYAYYNGYIYHVGYLIDRNKNNKEMQEKMLQITREFILGNSF